MSKKKYFLKNDSNDKRLISQNHYMHIFYDLFMNHFKINGIEYEENCFIFNRLWEDGKISCFKEKLTGRLIFQPFAEKEFNIYNFPIEAQIVPFRPAPFIPLNALTVNEDVVIMYANKARVPLKARVLYYVKKIVNIEMLIDQNVTSLKMPYLVTCSPEDKARLEDIVNRVLNDEDIIYLESEDIQSLKVLITSTPYMLDKLLQAKKERENELLTVLGINNVDIEKKEHLIVDEANANNQLISNHSNIYKCELENFIERINSLFGASLSIEEKEAEIMEDEADEEGEEENE